MALGGYGGAILGYYVVLSIWTEVFRIWLNCFRDNGFHGFVFVGRSCGDSVL